MINPDKIDELVKTINESTAKNKSMFEKFDNMTKDELLSKVRLCARKHTEEDIPKKEIMDLELYARIVEDEYSAVINKELTKFLDVSDDELFDSAKNNTDYSIIDICDIIPFGLPNQMMIISTADKRYGASCIGSTDILDEACNMLSVDEVIILPSSIHEVIAVRKENSDSSYLMNMVRDINESLVEDDCILSNTVYVYNRITKEFEIL